MNFNFSGGERNPGSAGKKRKKKVLSSLLDLAEGENQEQEPKHRHIEKISEQEEKEELLKENPNIYSYDDDYEETHKGLDNTIQSAGTNSGNKNTIYGLRRMDSTNRDDSDQKPKYIANLLEKAKIRKIENEIAVEKKFQKERKLEGEEFEGKDKYVTSSYKKKLDDMKLWDQERIKRDEEALDTSIEGKGTMGSFLINLMDNVRGESEKPVEKKRNPESKKDGKERAKAAEASVKKAEEGRSKIANSQPTVEDSEARNNAKEEKMKKKEAEEMKKKKMEDARERYFQRKKKMKN